MANITLKGSEIRTVGELPKVGEKAPDFTLTKGDLSKANLSDYAGKRLVLNIFPSIDTATCAASVRAFNKAAAELENTVVVNISRDLPFAQNRFCGAEGIENAHTLSDFADGSFGKDYGLNIIDGPLVHLHSRCVVVLNENGEVIHSEQVPEIVDEPNYEAALNAL